MGVVAAAALFAPGFSPVPGGGDYLVYAAAGACVATLLFLPGYVLQVLRPGWRTGEPALMPIPGMAALAGLGLVRWICGGNVGAVAALLLRACLWLAALWLAAARGRKPDRGVLRNRTLLVYAALVVGLGSYSAISLEVGQEIFKGSSWRTRMVASPPDASIPYTTAGYLQAGYGGHRNSDMYFGHDWSMASRGPLAPLMVLEALDVFRCKVTEPPSMRASPWPAADDGYYVARWLGILTNALILLAGDALLVVLAGGSPAARSMGRVWLALAPVTLINVAFLWPKLLATYFLLLGIRDVLARRSAGRIGFWAAASYLSHPVGALYFPALLTLVFAAEKGARFATRLGKCLGAALSWAVWGAPWFAYKLWLRRPDVFFRYIGGDGRAYAAARSWRTWVATRENNLKYTLIPGRFYFSHNMRAWIWGPLSPSLRWAIQAAKTLPGGLGFSWFWVAYAAAFGFGLAAARKRDSRVFLFAFLGPALLVATVFWGYSDDGLGRNCLEPISVIAIVWASAAFAWQPGLARWLPWLLWAEAVALMVSGFVGATGFSWSAIPAADAALFLILLAAMLVPVLFAGPVSASDSPPG